MDMSTLIDKGRGPLMLLFYDGYELRAEAGWLAAICAKIRRPLRFIKRSLLRQQVRSGFYTAFLALRDSLKLIGCDVRVNAFDMARKYPDYPIGVAGYPSVIDKMKLPNPRILGPGDFGTPPETEGLAKETRNAILIEPSDWFCDVYRPYWKDKLWTWFAGIDTHKFQDASKHVKDIDVLIYDKIRWYREKLVPTLLESITEYLRQQGHTFKVLRYGHHHHSLFFKTLKRSRSMIFLCEHETQGLAYQEAMAMNVPILAWDEGKIIDPTFRQYQPLASPVSSVPYFDERCGLTFTSNAFAERWCRFWQDISTYCPRHYVQTTLSLEISARKYFERYSTLASQEKA